MGTNQGGNGRVVYDPRGIVETVPRAIAARPANLNGLRLAVLDNTKWNAGSFLRIVSDELAKAYEFSAVTVYKKENFSLAASQELLDTIAANNDIALTAIGD